MEKSRKAQLGWGEYLETMPQVEEWVKGWNDSVN